MNLIASDNLLVNRRRIQITLHPLLSRSASTAAAMWYVYIVQCADRSLYTGITKDLEARVAQHNAGSAAKYTRARRPVELVYSEPAKGRGLAQRRESAIKRMQTSAKHRLIATATRGQCANRDGL